MHLAKRRLVPQVARYSLSSILKPEGNTENHRYPSGYRE